MSGELMTNPGGGFSPELPIGTVAEVEAAGLDPTKVRCCGDEKKGSPNLICKQSGACPFSRPRYGGFKGVSGPQEIAFEIITGDTLPDGSAVVQQGACPCHVWVAKLQKRAQFGALQREDGKPGEMISIIGLRPGDPYESQIQMPINVNGAVINQSKRMFDTLEKQGQKIDREDRRPAYDYIMVNVQYEVERHPRPGERKASSYSQRMMEKAKQRLLAEREFEDAVATERLAVRPPTGEQMDSLVKRGPGRPRKTEAVAAEPAE